MSAVATQRNEAVRPAEMKRRESRTMDKKSYAFIHTFIHYENLYSAPRPHQGMYSEALYALASMMLNALRTNPCDLARTHDPLIIYRA